MMLMTRTALFGALSTLFLISLIHPSSAQDFDESDVVVLDEESFAEKISHVKYALVEFYAPWCGHCKNLAPQYAAAATSLRHNADVILAKVDATENAELAQNFDVKGYPTLVFWQNGEWIPYNGGRDSVSIQRWVEKKMGPVSIPLASETDAVKTPAVVGFFQGNRDSELYETFIEAAKLPELEEFTFADAISTEETDRIVIFLPNGDAENPPAFDGYWDGDALNIPDRDPSVLRDWILNIGFPRVLTIPEQYKVAAARAYPLGIAFVDLDDDNQQLEEVLNEADKETIGTFTWAIADGTKFAKFAQELGLGTELPAIGALTLDQQRKYAYKHDLTNKDQLAAWAHGIVAGTAERFMKSEDAPESNDGDVDIVVGTTFDEIVFDEHKDVLLEIYAPWCGHCKKLAPIYESLGEHYAEDDNVIIAKVDATANDIPVVFKGFPTIKLFPAFPGGSLSAIDYNGARDLKSLIAFIEDNRQTDPPGDEPKQEL